MLTFEEISRLQVVIGDRTAEINAKAAATGRPLTETEKAELEKLAADYDRLEEAKNNIPNPLKVDPQNPLPQNRGRLSPSGHDGETYAVTPEGEKIRAFQKHEKLADHSPWSGREGDFSLAEFVRASMGIARPTKGQVLERGTATVPAYLGNRVIDMIRAKSVIVKSGALSITIPGPTNICRIVSDAEVFEHTEGVEDVDESIPVFEPVTLDPKSLGAVIPLTMELAEDAQNLDRVLQISISKAFAGKLDALCIATLLADVAIYEGAADPGDWLGLMDGLAEMLGRDMDIPGAMISSPADFVSRMGQTAREAGTWLTRNASFENTADLFTSNVPHGHLIMGDFVAGFGIGLRRDLSLELIRFSKHKALTHVLVCTMRAQGYVLQPDALYRLNYNIESS